MHEDCAGAAKTAVSCREVDPWGTSVWYRKWLVTQKLMFCGVPESDGLYRCADGLGCNQGIGVEQRHMETDPECCPVNVTACFALRALSSHL